MLNHSCQKKKITHNCVGHEGGMLQAGLVAQDSRGGAAAISKASSEASRFRV